MNVINYLRFLIIIGNIWIVCELSLWNGSDFGSRYQIEALDRNVHLNLLRKRLIGTEFVKSGKRWILEICLEKGCRVFFYLSDWSKYGEWQYVWQVVLCHIWWVTICLVNRSLLRFGEWRLWVVSLPRKVLRRRSTNFLKTWLLVS